MVSCGFGRMARVRLSSIPARKGALLKGTLCRVHSLSEANVTTLIPSPSSSFTTHMCFPSSPVPSRTLVRAQCAHCHLPYCTDASPSETTSPRTSVRSTSIR